MAGSIHTLDTLEELDLALHASGHQPILIFKHSPTCGTSAMAYEEIEDLAGSAGAPPTYVVQVRARRAISDAIASRLGTRHESPQVLLLRDGRTVWTASHWRVTADAIAKKLAEIGGVSARSDEA